MESSYDYKVVDLTKSLSNSKDPHHILMHPKILHLYIKVLDFHDVTLVDKDSSEE